MTIAFLLLAPSLDFFTHTATARCPNGSHLSPDRSHCEKVKPHSGLKRCPNGSHRSPDGSHCEKVKDKKSSSSSKDKNDDKNSSKNNKSSKSKSKTTHSESNTDNNPTLPAPTLNEGIEISGRVTHVVDGDTLDINNIRFRLALVNTPEIGQPGYASAKSFVEDHCLNKNGEVDLDDGQRGGSFGREIGVVYRDGMNLNQALMSNNLAVILTEFCEISEFANDAWAKSSCSPNSNEDQSNYDSQDTNSISPNSNSNLQSDTTNYVLVTKWGGFGNGHGQFNHPSSIEADENGQRLYISDLDNNRVTSVGYQWGFHY